MEEMRFGTACVVSLEAGFSSSVPGQVKRTHRKIKKCGAVPPLMFESIFVPGSEVSPGKMERDSGMACLQVAYKLGGGSQVSKTLQCEKRLGPHNKQQQIQ